VFVGAWILAVLGARRSIKPKGIAVSVIKGKMRELGIDPNRGTAAA
jgi:hypothetical protein